MKSSNCSRLSVLITLLANIFIFIQKTSAQNCINQYLLSLNSKVEFTLAGKPILSLNSNKNATLFRRVDFKFSNNNLSNFKVDFADGNGFVAVEFERIYSIIYPNYGSISIFAKGEHDSFQSNVKQRMTKVIS